VLTLDPKIFGTIPANPQPTDTTFFRLWNDIALVTDFANKEIPNDLGIILEFDAPAGANYTPGDFWTFAVRAGEIFNPQVLIDHKAPQGIHYHRVALAVLDWVSNTTVADPIEDCRHLFQPLTRLATCCSFRVGDGMSSWGDFDNIQDAIDALPVAGGEVCVLPGEYKENVTIAGRSNITIKGCGKRSRLVAVKDEPAILIKDSQLIKIESLAIFATQKGPGVSLEGEEQKGEEGGNTRDITLEKLYIEAAQRSAIEAMFAIVVMIRHCDIEMSDEPSDAPGIFFTGDDSWIEHNIVRVISARFKGLELLGQTLDTEAFLTVSAGRGGIQIGGTSDRVRIFDNLIQGGQGNGITLGSLAEVGQDRPIKIYVPGTKGILDPCDPCKDVDTSKPPGISVDPGVEIVSAGALNEIYIERNLIYNMGSNGIGVASFWDLREKDEFITVDRLTIVDNEIRRCMLRNVADIPDNMLNSVGYGGIALADVDYLVIRDNVIENNGPNQLFPICGIFVLHGDGIEISRNRIFNNGADRGDASAKNAHPGARGGIYIVFAVAPRVPVLSKSQGKVAPAQIGVPAAKIHDNIVSSPLGQALIMAALGPVSVLGNQLTTHGVIPRQDSSTFWASTVLILNLGLSNELYFQM